MKGMNEAVETLVHKQDVCVCKADTIITLTVTFSFLLHNAVVFVFEFSLL